MTDDLSALIARLEAAEVGSLELDGEIYEALNPTHRSVPHQIGRYFDPAVISVHAAEKGTFVAPRHTTSLDSALALAERVLGNGPCVLHRNGPSEWGFTYVDDDTAYAATPALALCIAILRAKQGEKT